MKMNSEIAAHCAFAVEYEYIRHGDEWELVSFDYFPLGSTRTCNKEVRLVSIDINGRKIKIGPITNLRCSR